MEGEEFQEVIEDGSQLTSQQLNQALTKREKIISTFILLFGFFVLFVGGAFWFHDLQNPFANIIKIGQEKEQKLIEQKRFELLALQSLDTDNDGLSDYLEVNQHKTSPYLSDSDGDAIDDALEVARGSNPNCPEGQDCFDGFVVLNDTFNDIDAGLGDSGSVVRTSSVPQLQTAPPTVAKKPITADYIRSIMKQNGATEEELNAFSDEDLVSQFQTYLKDNPDSAKFFQDGGYDVAFLETTSTSAYTPQISGNDLSALNISSVDDLKNLSGAQIRQLMVNSGASATLLNSVSDEELKTMFINQLTTKLNQSN